MAFLPNIPQSTDKLSISQGNILNNFQILGAIAGNANPASGSLNATAGFNWLYLPSQGATPPAGSAFPAGQVGLYSFINATTTRRELYINKTTFAGVLTQVPATAAKVTVQNPVAFTGQSTGWTYLPSGCLMVWGNGTTGVATNVLVTYSSVSGFPGFTIGGVPLVTRLNTATSSTNYVYVQASTINNFRVYGSSGASTNIAFTWFAIGQ